MKNFLGIILGLFGHLVVAQEGLNTLSRNLDIIESKIIEPKASLTFDSSFIYVTDTLNLPFFDEFSRNNFQNYTKEYNGVNTTSAIYFAMLDEVFMQPLPVNSQFTDSVTYRLEVDLVQDTIIYFFNDSVRFLYDDLVNYPPNHNSSYGYPPYIIFDTIDVVPNDPDTIWINQIDYFQDSARIFITELDNSDKFWLNHQAYHNYRLAKEPWSLGIVSFDGLNEHGYPYLFGSNSTMTCDTLLSKPLDLSVNVGDSVYFSFLYQSEGYGDAPEETDSLYLDFYSNSTSQWTRVWSGGRTDSNKFEVGHIKIDDPNYLQNGFQFRFMNLGSPAGFLDHFHIDYVYLRQFSGYQDTLFKDFAFVYPISSLLEEYISVPWKHYRNNPTNKMSQNVEVVVRNGSELTENNQNGNVAIFYNGNLEGNHLLNGTILSGGNINYEPRSIYYSLHDFSTGYAIDETVSNDTSAVFNWIANASAQFSSFPLNDSTFGAQTFLNYYAYDDGTAEKAYGIIGQQSLLAYQFNAYQADSLIGIDIQFVPSVVDVSNNLFLLTVWNDNNGIPGTKLYEDEFFFPNQPKYVNGRNQFATYFFKDTIKVAVDQKFYVGMRQIDEDRLNIGFDMNHNNADKIFWSIDGGNQWNNSSYAGSLLMRPIVTSKLDYTLGINTNLKDDEIKYVLFPNPATNHCRIETNPKGLKMKIGVFDVQGREILFANTNELINLDRLQAGVYFLNVFSNQGEILSSKKLILE